MVRIGIDIDGVLADCGIQFLHYINHRYGTQYKVDIFTSLYFTDHVKEIKNSEEVYSDWFQSPYFHELPVIKDSKKNLEILQKDYELIVITSRSDDLREMTMKFLDQFSIPFKVYFGNEFDQNSTNKKFTKMELCKKLNVDIMIDDAIRHVQECAFQGDIPCILFGDYPWNREKRQELLKHSLVVHADSWDDVPVLIRSLFKQEKL